MPASKVFLDTNVLLYLLPADAEKVDRAEALVENGAIISVQVLNEMTNVMLRKLVMSWREIEEVLTVIRAVSPVEPLTIDAHDLGMRVAECYQLSVYDAMIAAAALLVDCEIPYSEDMHSGLLIEDQLRVINPFIT